MGIRFVRSWKTVALRGAAAVLFGLVTLLSWGITLPALVVLFGVYALIDGAMALTAGSHPGATELRWLLEGLFGMSFGLIALLWVGMTWPMLTGLVALWALLMALLESLLALRMRDHEPGELSLVFAGAGALLLGVVLLFWPTASPFAFVVLLGGCAMIFGTSMLTLAWQLRKTTRRVESFHARIGHGARRRHA